MKNKFALMSVDTETIFYIGALMEEPIKKVKCVLTEVFENGYSYYIDGEKFFQYISECSGWEIIKVAPYKA